MLLKVSPGSYIPEQLHSDAAAPFLSGCCLGEHTWEPFRAVFTHCPLRTKPVFLCGALIPTQIGKTGQSEDAEQKDLLLSRLSKP